MDARQERIGRNEAIFRTLNDAVSELQEGFRQGDGLVAFRCECGNSGCDEPTARQQLEALWPHLVAWNDDFAQFLTNEFIARRHG